MPETTPPTNSEPFKEPSPESLYERPLECGECKKPLDVFYTEVQGSSLNECAMCRDCPILRKRLHGSSFHSPQELSPGSAAGLKDQKTAVCCGGCGTTQEEVSMGAKVGCPLCYEVFEDEIIEQMGTLHKFPIKKPLPSKEAPFVQRPSGLPHILHKGRHPSQKLEEMDPSSQLVSLQQSLYETLSREDYEQAAWLRDKIRKIAESPDRAQNSEPTA